MLVEFAVRSRVLCPQAQKQGSRPCSYPDPDPVVVVVVVVIVILVVVILIIIIIISSLAATEPASILRASSS